MERFIDKVVVFSLAYFKIAFLYEYSCLYV